MTRPYDARFPDARPRRMRRDDFSRRLMRETRLSPEDFIYPVFVLDGEGREEPVASLPGVARKSIDRLYADAEACVALGVPAIALFPVIPTALKSADASQAWRRDDLVPRTVAALKRRFPELGVITDVALDPYTSHGQDGLIDQTGYVVNDETVEALVRQALNHAQAGADMVAPSDMMDGRVAAIRDELDCAGFVDIPIMAYAAKFASCFYAPFRDAANSSPQFGDRQSYQMDPANKREALREIDLDIEEGADIIMVKPAMPYLDIISAARERTLLPIAAYQVSGEYSMIKAAAQAGWLDERRAMLESLLSIKRAGAELILTYFAKEAAGLLQSRPA